VGGVKHGVATSAWRACHSNVSAAHAGGAVVAHLAVIAASCVAWQRPAAAAVTSARNTARALNYALKRASHHRRLHSRLRHASLPHLSRRIKSRRRDLFASSRGASREISHTARSHTQPRCTALCASAGGGGAKIYRGARRARGSRPLRRLA